MPQPANARRDIISPVMPDVDKNPADKGIAVAELLLRWYDENARTLPWRAPPHTNRSLPYHVWLSEIMLQQTTVAAVKPYFAEFTSRWPDIVALAAADEAAILSAWAGLGYYARARNLVKCAKIIVAEYDGEFPSTEAALRELPGIGDYTAAAVAAIAFGRRAVVIDANVERVITRLFAVKEPLPNARKTIRDLTNSITPDVRSGDFAQAMMDLGAGVCRAKEARCCECVLQPHCQAVLQGQPLRYPVKKPKAKKPLRTGHAYWIECDDKIWLTTRPPSGMLGGMRALPDDGWKASRNGDAVAPLAGQWAMTGDPVIHSFTHFTIQLQLMSLQIDARMMASTMNGLDGEWWPITDLDRAGLPTLFVKAVQPGIGGARRLL